MVPVVTLNNTFHCQSRTSGNHQHYGQHGRYRHQQNMRLNTRYLLCTSKAAGCASRHHRCMKAYSLDLRLKIVEFVRRGASKSETARRFGVNRSTVKRYLKQLATERSALREAGGLAGELGIT